MLDMLVERKPDGKWPTLGDCIASGRRVVVLKMAGCDPTDSGHREGENQLDAGLKKDQMDNGAACPKGFHKAFDVSYDTPYALGTMNDVYKAGDEALGFDMSVQDRGGAGYRDGNMFIMNHFITPPVAALALEFNKAELLQDRMEQLEEKVCDRVGIIAVDFWSVEPKMGPVVAAQRNNGRPLPTCQADTSVVKYPT